MCGLPHSPVWSPGRSVALHLRSKHNCCRSGLSTAHLGCPAQGPRPSKASRWEFTAGSDSGRVEEARREPLEEGTVELVMLWAAGATSRWHLCRGPWSMTRNYRPGAGTGSFLGLQSSSVGSQLPCTSSMGMLELQSGYCRLPSLGCTHSRWGTGSESWG